MNKRFFPIVPQPFDKNNLQKYRLTGTYQPRKFLEKKRVYAITTAIHLFSRRKYLFGKGLAQ